MAKKHPNRQNFEGVLTRLDQPSDAAPHGTRGHRLCVTAEVAREALPSLLGMPVGFGPAFDEHNYQGRCGLITEAEIVGDELQVRGYLWCMDFPQVVKMMEGGKLGMSFELDSAHVRDMRAEIWEVTRFTFRGAALVLAEKAAYRTTRAHICASGDGQEQGEVQEIALNFALCNLIDDAGGPA